MGRRKIIEYATQAFAIAAIEVKGAEYLTKRLNAGNSVKAKENAEHSLTGSGLFGRKDN